MKKKIIYLLYFKGFPKSNSIFSLKFKKNVSGYIKSKKKV